MVIYQCPRCRYSSNDKTKMRNHYNRLVSCSVIYEDVPIVDCLDDLNHKKFHVCQFCEKTFKRKSHLDRHNNNCKSKSLVEENKFLKEKVEKLEKTALGSISNSVIGDNNTVNTNTINIHINDFKNTNYQIALDDLRSSIKQSLLKNNHQNKNIECENLIELVHCNDKYPENQNILLTDRNRGEVKVKKGENFINVPIDDAIDETTDNIINLLKDNQLFTRYIEFHENKDEDTRKEDKKAIERTLYNNRHRIQETATQNGVKIK